MLFRFAIVADLMGTVMFICLGIALYRLFSEVNKTQAWLMVAFVRVSATVAFVNVLNEFAALMLFRGGDFLAYLISHSATPLGCYSFACMGREMCQRDVLGSLALAPRVAGVQSRFLPRFLGAWLVLDCFAWLADSLTDLLAPQYSHTVYQIVSPIFFGEVAIMLWLLIRGANAKALPATTA